MRRIKIIGGKDFFIFILKFFCIKYTFKKKQQNYIFLSFEIPFSTIIFKNKLAHIVKEIIGLFNFYFRNYMWGKFSKTYKTLFYCFSKLFSLKFAFFFCILFVFWKLLHANIINERACISHSS